MQILKVLIISATITLGATGLVVAQTDNDDGARAPVMPMRLASGNFGPMRGGAGMTDQGMVEMMMGPGMMAMPSAEEASGAMRARMMEFDVDGDGNLSLGEFETLHSAMTREMTVDRFQHFDADGDGAVSPSEMFAPVRRMHMRSGIGRAPMVDADN